MSLSIVFDRVDRIFREGDKVAGNLIVDAPGGFAHSGINIEITGLVTLQLSAKTVGLFEAFYQSLKPVSLLDYSITIEETGKIADVKTEIPFEFDLKPLAGQELFETYHGVYVNIVYTVKATIIRKYLGKNLQTSIEFIVQTSPKPPVRPQREDFWINPDSVEAKKGIDKNVIPDFSIKGHLDSITLPITSPFSGALVLEKCDEPIKSIEIQLVRVETCGCTDGFATDGT
eukprot:TRINITY_DN4270_c0_g1_i11.p1 TRINITY_DN4270_c0_g1~~TRINITY_DN4270_c0_g1_i11.p1  ORF type:complete len:230 (-),score=39.22 TRINITY_DN4270_c0_g1_i11:402-1091(-)